MGTAMVAGATSNASYFLAYELLRPTAEHHLGPSGFIVAAGLSRLFSVTLTSPFEKLRTRLQAHGSAAKLQLSLSGFHGLKATFIRDLLFTSVYFGVMENMYKGIGASPDKNDNRARTISSLSGGLLAALCTHPFDVLKTKMQTQFCCYGAYDKTPLKALRNIVKDEGLGILMAGAGPRVSKLVPGLVLYISAYEGFKRMME